VGGCVIRARKSCADFLVLSRFGGRALEGEFLDLHGKRRPGSFYYLQASGLRSRKLAALTPQHEGWPARGPLGSVFEPTRLLLDSTTFCGVHFYRSCGLGYGRERNRIRPRHGRAWDKELRCPAFPGVQHAQSAASCTPERKLRRPAITKAQSRSPIAS
jgi:hypothetical protein